MFEVREATLDDWEDIKIMADKVLSQAKFFPFYENSVKCIDFSRNTLEGYLLRSKTLKDFKLYLLVHPFEEVYKVKGFLVIQGQTQPSLKTLGAVDNVAFVPSVFCMHGIDARLMQKAILDFCTPRNIGYVYGNVKSDGAYSHFLEKFGAQEISRTLLIEMENFKNG